MTMPDPHGYQLVVIDSTGEAMAAGGVDSNADREVAQWFALVKQLCRLPGGPAVIVLDHVPKAQDAPSSYAIGSQRKRAAITGASYRVDTIKEPAKGRDGKLKLTVAKDRLGNRPKGSVAAQVDVVSTGDAVELRFAISDAQAAAAAGERFRPTVLMERVSRFIEDAPGASKNVTLKAVSGKRDAIVSAIEILLEEGWITATSGPRGAIELTSVRPFRDGFRPVDNSEIGPPTHLGPTSAPPRPGRGQTTSAHLGPRFSSEGRGDQVSGQRGDLTSAPVDNYDISEELF